MHTRLVSATFAIAVVLAVATGCTPEPAPSPSATGFATEDEAFAAAEATYRAYVDALNQVDLSDPATFEVVYAWTTGDLNASDRKGLTAYHADGVNVSGDSVPTVVKLSRYDAQTMSVILAVCVDISDVSVTGADGTSLGDPNRTDVQTLSVTLKRNSVSPTALFVESIGPREGDPPCN